jgi:hypothetical protein
MAPTPSRRVSSGARAPRTAWMADVAPPRPASGPPRGARPSAHAGPASVTWPWVLRASRASRRSTCRAPNGFTRAAGCTSACNVDAECPAEWACEKPPAMLDNRGTPVTSDDVLGDNSYCIPAPGSRMACVRPADCPAGESCVPHAGGAQISGWCLQDVQGGAALGESCEQGTCASDICVYRPREWGRGRCSEVCSMDADCPGGLVCRNFLGTGGNPAQHAVRMCVEPDDPRIVP